MQRVRRVLLGLSVGAGACGSFEDDEFESLEMRELALGGTVVEPSSRSGEDGGRLGGDWIINGLSEPSVSGVDPSFALESPQGLGVDGWLGDGDLDGEDVIRYMVECALPSGDTVEVLDPSGELHLFDGGLGLAPEWKTQPCNTECQQWVSACLLARTNEDGTEVSIFVQGDHPALGFGLAPQFPHYEATFFGNVFSDPESMHACRGDVLGVQKAAQQGRTCALASEECGFTTYADCVANAGCGVGPTGLPTACQPDPAGPSYPGIVVHVTGGGGGGGCEGHGH